jgi:hypothetical protein
MFIMLISSSSGYINETREVLCILSTGQLGVQGSVQGTALNSFLLFDNSVECPEISRFGLVSI